MRIRTIIGWLVLFLGVAFMVQHQVVQIPTGIRSGFENGVDHIQRGIDSMLDSNWNFNQNQSQKNRQNDQATPVASIIKGKKLSKTYYYSYEKGTPASVQKVFQEAVDAYNQTGIVKLIPGKERSWLNHITLGSYQKAGSNNPGQMHELGVGGPEIIEQQGIVSRIANHASAKLNIYYNRSISKSVALHEVGHALGLDHSQSLTSIMYPIDRRQMSLSQRDLDGLKLIYPK